MKFFLSLTGTVFSVLVLLAHFLSHIDPCTMGSTDGFATGYSLFIFFGSISSILLLLTFSSNYMHRWLAFTIYLLLLIVSIEPGIESAFYGGHLCDALEEETKREIMAGENIHFYYYPVLWLLCFIGLALSRKPIKFWSKLTALIRSIASKYKRHEI